MNWNQLFYLQKELDDRIKNEHELKGESIIEDKILALLVELGELANETRCFKFWSKKEQNEAAAILEEYVDALHFILSLGIELGVKYKGYEETNKIENYNLTNEFTNVYEAVLLFKDNQDQTHFTKLCDTFMSLGIALGFAEELIQKAYISKNEVNHVRQNEGY